MQERLLPVFILRALPAAGPRQHQLRVPAPQAARGRGSSSGPLHHHDTRLLTLWCATLRPGKNGGFGGLQIACHWQLEPWRVFQTFSGPPQLVRQGNGRGKSQMNSWAAGVGGAGTLSTPQGTDHRRQDPMGESAWQLKGERDLVAGVKRDPFFLGRSGRSLSS